MKTRHSIVKQKEELELAGVDDSIRTYITHNKGGRWDLIKAPTVDSKGDPIKCYIEEGCSLHLQIYSSNGVLPPPYS